MSISRRALLLALVLAARGPCPGTLARAPGTHRGGVCRWRPADIVARIVAGNLSRMLGQPFPVDNRAGAGGQIGTDFCAKAPGDGYSCW